MQRCKHCHAPLNQADLFFNRSIKVDGYQVGYYNPSWQSIFAAPYPRPKLTEEELLWQEWHNIGLRHRTLGAEPHFPLCAAP